METPAASSTSSTKPMSLGGIYKYGKWMQAKSYGKGLRLADDNARAGFNHAWQMAAQATGINGPQGGKTMPAEDDTAYIDSPVTNHYHQQPQKPSMLGTVASMALGAGLMAAGIPLGMAMLGNGAKDVVKEVVTPAEKPQPAERPAVKIGGYELRLGK